MGKIPVEIGNIRLVCNLTPDPNEFYLQINESNAFFNEGFEIRTASLNINGIIITVDKHYNDPKTDEYKELNKIFKEMADYKQKYEEDANMDEDARRFVNAMKHPIFNLERAQFLEGALKAFPNPEKGGHFTIQIPPDCEKGGSFSMKSMNSVASKIKEKSEETKE